jgi:kojibiose phosphorylase
MVAFVLELASRVGGGAGAAPEECRAFAAAAAGLPVPRGQDRRLVLQCEDFDRFAEPGFDAFWTDRARTFAAHVSQERLYRCKCLKQADVLMLMMVFPREFSDEEVSVAWDFYVPVTTHDSSLSAGAHAIVACRLGKAAEAYRFWQMSADKDLDVAHGGAEQGIHIAGCGANWQIAVFGFAGMRSALQAEAFTLSPQLPAAWERLAFNVMWRGIPVRVDITRAVCRVENRGEEALACVVWGRGKTLEAGETVAFEL